MTTTSSPILTMSDFDRVAASPNIWRFPPQQFTIIQPACSLYGQQQYQVLLFSVLMLPSLGEKHDYGQRVRKPYRQRELQEVARIHAQIRALPAFPPWEVAPTDRYGIGYIFEVATELRSDLTNYEKPTEDLFGSGRYEWVGSGKRRHKVFVPHGQVIQNDNRVMSSFKVKRVVGRGHLPWATIAIFKYQEAKDAGPVLPSSFEQVVDYVIATIFTQEKGSSS